MRAVVSVLGQDRPGIVSQVSAILADSGANIEDISQTILSGLFAMIMLVTIEETGEGGLLLDELKSRLDAAGEQLGVQIQIQNEDIFRYMHRV